MDENDWLSTPAPARVCPMCGQDVSPRARECPGCGEVLVPQVEPVSPAAPKRRGSAAIMVCLLSAGLGAFAGWVTARLLFGPNRVGNDGGYDASFCIGAVVGGLAGWICCETFGWDRNPAVQWLLAGLFFVLLLGTCVASAVF